jgi:hypothetical protein
VAGHHSLAAPASQADPAGIHDPLLPAGQQQTFPLLCVRHHRVVTAGAFDSDQALLGRQGRVDVCLRSIHWTVGVGGHSRVVADAAQTADRLVGLRGSCLLRLHLHVRRVLLSGWQRDALCAVSSAADALQRPKGHQELNLPLRLQSLSHQHLLYLLFQGVSGLRAEVSS